MISQKRHYKTIKEYANESMLGLMLNFIMSYPNYKGYDTGLKEWDNFFSNTLENKIESIKQKLSEI